MTLGSCTSEHSMEHAMSAYHQRLPHGAGLIMLSKAYYEYFISQHVRDARFVRMAKAGRVWIMPGSRVILSRH